jgi:hypothetical protein
MMEKTQLEVAAKCSKLINTSKEVVTRHVEIITTIKDNAL